MRPHLAVALGIVATTSCSFGVIADGASSFVGVVRTSNGEALSGVSLRIASPQATSRRAASPASGCVAMSLTHEPGRVEVTIELDKPGYKPWRRRIASGLYVADVVMSRADEAGPSTGEVRRLAPEDKKNYPCWLA